MKKVDWVVCPRCGCEVRVSIPHVCHKESTTGTINIPINEEDLLDDLFEMAKKLKEQAKKFKTNEGG